MALQPLVTGVLGRNFYNGDLDGYNPEVTWASLQASPGAAIGGAGKNKIDNLISGSIPFRVRIKCGIYAPEWVKTAVGSFQITNVQDGSSGYVPKWWTQAYVDYYEDFMQKLSALYDGQIPLIWEGAGMHIYVEPFQRQFTSSNTTTETQRLYNPSNGQFQSTGVSKTGVQWAAENRANAVAAGYSYSGGSETIVGADLWALKQFRNIMIANWTDTRIGIAYNVYQYIDDSGNGVLKTAETRRQEEIWWAAIGTQHVIQNNSIGSHLISNPNGPRPYTTNAVFYQDIIEMHAKGAPISFQTEIADRVGDLNKTVQLAADMGAHAVEVPSQYASLSTLTQRDAWRVELAANAAEDPVSPTNKSKTYSFGVLRKKKQTKSYQLLVELRTNFGIKKTHGFDVRLFSLVPVRKTAFHGITVLVDNGVTQTNHKVSHYIAALISANAPQGDYFTDGRLDRALAAATIYTKNKVLMTLSNNANYDAQALTGDDEGALFGNISGSIVDAWDICSMKYAFADSDATTNAGYRLFPGTDTPIADSIAEFQKVPWVSERTTNTSGLFSTPVVITVTYPQQVSCNKIVIQNDSFQKNGAGVMTNMTVRIRRNGVWSTILTNANANTAPDSYRPDIYLQSDNGTTWAFTQPSSVPAPITDLTDIEISVNSLSVNAGDPADTRRLIVYEVDAKYDIDISLDVLSIGIQEQRDLTSQTLSPLGTSAANTFTLSLENSSNDFNNYNPDSPYFGLLNSNVRFDLQIGFLLETDDYGYVDYGTMYADEWNLSPDTVSVEVSGRDFSRFMMEGLMPSMFYEGFEDGFLLHQVIQDVAERAGVAHHDIDLSELSTEDLAVGIEKKYLGTDDLVEVVQHNVIWNQDQTYWNFLQQVAYVDLGVFWFGRDNVFRYKSKESLIDSTRPDFDVVATLSDDVEIIDAGIKTELIKNSIKVDYNVPTLTGDPTPIWSLDELLTVSSTSLAAPVDAATDTFNVGDISDWPKQGFFAIDDEVIEYQNRTDFSFLACKRGALDTQPAPHYPEYDTDNWAFVGGDWSIAGGNLRADSQGADDSVEANWGTAIYTGPTNLADGNGAISGDRYNISGKLLITESPYKVAILVRMNDAGTKYYKFVIKSKPEIGDTNGVVGDEAADLYLLYSVDNGTRTLKKSSGRAPLKEVTTNIEATWKVVIDEEHLALFINGSRVLGYNIDPATDLHNDAPWNFGLSSIGDGPNYFDDIIVTKLPNSKEGEHIIYAETFGTPVYEVRKFEMDYANPPARGIDYVLTNLEDLDVILFRPGAFSAVAYIKNRRDALSIVAGALDGSDQVPEYFYLTGQSVEKQTTETLEKVDNRSITKFGKQELQLSLPWVESDAHARKLLNYLIDIYREPVALVDVNTFALPTLELGDLVRLDYPRLGFAGDDFHITNINTTLDGTGISQSMTLRKRAEASFTPRIGTGDTAVSCPIAQPPESFYIDEGAFSYDTSFTYNGYNEEIVTIATGGVPTAGDGLKIPVVVWRPSNTSGAITQGLMAPAGSALSGPFKTILWAHEAYPATFTEVANKEQIKRWLIKIVRQGYNVIFVEYRGTGGITGTAAQQKTHYNAHSILHAEIDDMKVVRDWADAKSYVSQIIFGGYGHGANMALYGTTRYPTDFDGYLAICGTPNIGCSMQSDAWPDYVKERISLAFGGDPLTAPTDYLDLAPSLNPGDVSASPILMVSGGSDSFARVEDVYDFYTTMTSAPYNRPDVTLDVYLDRPQGWLFTEDGGDATIRLKFDPWLRIMDWLDNI